LRVGAAAAPVEGSWSTPAGCVNDSCVYGANWSLDPTTDIVTFTVAAKQAHDRWTGIAFAPDKKMVLYIVHCQDRYQDRSYIIR